jgi:RNA polymerase sigma factor (sigma-70 family)
MTKHIETRRKIKDIASVSSFNELIEAATLTDDDKRILKMHYLSGYDFRMIGDALGYSESTIKRRHKKALTKIGKIL